MAIEGTMIDVKNGLLIMTVHDITAEFKIFEATKSPSHSHEFFQVDIFDHLVNSEFLISIYKDHFKACMNSPNKDFELPSEVLEAQEYMEAVPKYFKHQEPCFEPLRGFPSKLEPSTSVPSKLELKPLPCYLKYVYLGEKEMLPTIIASYLSKEEKEKLLRVLKEYKVVIGWTITDIKGINHSKCMH